MRFYICHRFDIENSSLHVLEAQRFFRPANVYFKAWIFLSFGASLAFEIARYHGIGRHSPADTGKRVRLCDLHGTEESTNIWQERVGISVGTYSYTVGNQMILSAFDIFLS